MVEKEMPLVEAIDGFLKKEYAYFAIPGHRYESGMPPSLRERFGPAVYRYDLTEAPGLDDLHHAKGAILKARKRAAELFGADECRFSVNGTTALIEAMILSVCAPGDELILARDVHRSAVSGLILSGAKPVWIMPDGDPEWNVSNGIKPERVEEAILSHPEAKAVLVVSPTYYGQASDLAAIAGICHSHGMALLVDAAHGSHFRFSDAYPADAVSAGADLTAMSLHKTTGAMTQSSMLFYKKNDPKPVSMERLDAALRMTISSSPSYVLMASLDAARQQLFENGEQMAEEAIEKALDLRRALSEIPGVKVRGGSDLFSLIRREQDVTRVVFCVPGLSGTKLAESLEKEGNTVIEMADARNAVAVVTSANTRQDILKLSMAVMNASRDPAREEETSRSRCASFGDDANECEKSRSRYPMFGDDDAKDPEMVLSPRDAFFAEKEELPVSETIGRICADMICPYPPGIPVLVPGEQISEKEIRFLEEMVRLGIPVQGMSEEERIWVLKSN